MTRPKLALALALALVALVQALVAVRYRPPPPRGAATPPDQFSAERARSVLTRVLADGAPHPVGSAENARVRGRIARELTALGLTAETQRGAACSRWGTCAEVHNLVARIEGRTSGRPLLLVAHHDSVPAGPGAGDDGSGVATLLEVARALQHAPAQRPVVLLFDDGEELGLLGAEVFARDTPWLSQVSAVINVEARGTSGPSLLFETSGGSARFARLAARALERPITSSLSVAVYRRLPNDTDLTVFSRHGLPGANFAFIADVAHYHTPLDDLEHLDTASLQHHGDNVLALTRALSEDTSDGAGDAVWFDVLSLAVVHWPLESTWPLVAGALVLCGIAGAVAARRLPLRGADVLRALVAFPATLALAGSLGLTLDFALSRLGAVPQPWIAHPAPVLLASWALAGAGVALAASIAGRKPGPREHWVALWFWWLLLAIALAARLPEASYLALVPVALAAAAALVTVAAPERLAAVGAYVPLTAVLVIWLPIVRLLVDAIGFFSLAPYPVALAIALTPLLPLLGWLPLRQRLLLSAAGAGIGAVAAAAATLLPAYSAETPQRVTFALHHDGDAGTARWLVEAPFGDVPDTILTTGGFARELVSPHPWVGTWEQRAHAAPADVAAPPAPLWENARSDIDALGRKVVRARLRSQRGAELLGLHVPPDVTVSEVRLAGLRALPRQVGAHRVYLWAGPASAGVDVELTLPSAAGVEVLVTDHGFGLPPEAAPLLRARPESAVPSQLGDLTVVSRRVRL